MPKILSDFLHQADIKSVNSDTTLENLIPALQGLGTFCTTQKSTDLFKLTWIEVVMVETFPENVTC